MLSDAGVNSAREREYSMLRAATGLTQVSTPDLKKAFKALHRGELECPLTIADLTRVGLQHCAGDLLEMLRGLDHAGVRAVLVAVIAERLAQEKAKG